MMLNAPNSNRWFHWTQIPEPAIALLVFAAAMAYFNSTLHLTLEMRDEGFLLYRIARVADGEIPNRDFVEEYGVGVYAVTAPIFKLFGESVFAIREFVAAFRALAVVLSYLIARHFVSRPFALLGACIAAAHWGRVIWALNTPYAALFTIPLCMLSLALLLHGQARESRGSYVWSGLVCGAALTFKWTLAAVSAYGMVLAICAGAMLQEPPPGSPRQYRTPVLLGLALAAIAIFVPFYSTLSPLDYALHIAPIHGSIALVGFRFARFGDGRSAATLAIPLVSRYCLGFLLVPSLMAACYLSWGTFDDLLYNTVYRPLHYLNYYKSISPPRLGGIVLLGCIITWVTAALALLRRSYRIAGVLALMAALLTPIAFGEIRARGNISVALEYILIYLPTLSAFATLAFVAPPLMRSRPLESKPALSALIAALFFQEMMSFQIFPRSSYNMFLMMGTLGPLCAYLSYRWYAFADVGDTLAAGWRRPLAFALAAALPVLCVGEIVRTAVLAPRPSELSHTALRSPALAGIHPKPEQYKRQDIGAFDALIQQLDRMQPADAPIFAVQNEPMIYFLSEREPLFADHTLTLFLAGWGMLPPNDRYAPTSPELIGRLERSPETIVVVRQPDPTTRKFINYYPQVMRYIRENFQVEHQISDYQILRRTEAK
jgi:hypothetical protein